MAYRTVSTPSTSRDVIRNRADQQRTGRRGSYLPNVANNNPPLLDRTGPRLYGLAVERHLGRLRRLPIERSVLERPVLERPVLERPVLERPVLERPVHRNQESIFYHDLESPPNDTSIAFESRQDWQRYERVLCYATYILLFGLSAVQVNYLEEMMKFLYEHDPPISHHDIDIFFKDILEGYKITISYYCCSCTSLMESSQTHCENPTCAIYRQNIKRTKRMQRTEVHLIDLKPQLEDILRGNIGKIIRLHEDLHRHRGNLNGNCGDIRYFDGYTNFIENLEDFRDKHLKVLLSVSLDGFSPRRLSKREVWPLYLRVDGLPYGDANNFYNSIISGVIFTRLKPNDKLLEALFTRLDSEITYLRGTPMRIDVNGMSWTVHIELNRGVADMAAQQIIFGVPKWTGDYGCSKCLIKGVRMGSQRLWIRENEHDSILRTRESYLVDARLRRFGLTKTTPIMRLLLPCDFPSDALHVCSEGVTRDRLRDMFSASSKFAELKVDSVSTQKLKQSLMGTSFYTYSNSIVLSLEDLPSCTAAEVDELAFVVFPLSVAVGAIRCPTAGVSLVGYWLCLKMISRHADLTRNLISDAQMLAGLTKDIWIDMAPEICTMKFHWFFDHAMQEEITTYGSPYQWSASPFESHHRRLQIGVNQTTTNSAATIVERYLLLKKIRIELNERAESGSRVLRALKEKMENQERIRYPEDIRINDFIYVPKNSRLSLEELQGPDPNLVSCTHDKAYSRLVVNGKIYSSGSYHGRDRRSRQDLFYFEEEDGADGYGSVVLFLHNTQNNNIRVVLREYRTEDCFANLEHLIENSSNQSSRRVRDLLNIIRRDNRYFREIRGYDRKIRSASIIKGICVLIKYENRSFVLRH